MIARLSERSKKIKPSFTLEMTSKVAKLRSKGVDVINFSAGQPDFNTPKNIINAATKAMNTGLTKYTSGSGMIELREAICNKLANENYVNANINQVLVDAWKSTSKGSDGLDQLCKLTGKLPVESVLNIFMIAGRASCFLAILNHKEFEKISDEYRGQVEDDLISKLRTEKVSTESKRKSTGSIKSGRQEKSREHNLKIYARLGQINDLEMKLMDLDDILVCSIAYYLAKKGTNDITEYKKSFGITSGSGSKAKHIEAILKHFNIEIDESVKEIIRLFSK